MLRQEYQIITKSRTPDWFCNFCARSECRVEAKEDSFVLKWRLVMVTTEEA